MEPFVSSIVYILADKDPKGVFHSARFALSFRTRLKSHTRWRALGQLENEWISIWTKFFQQPFLHQTVRNLRDFIRF